MEQKLYIWKLFQKYWIILHRILTLAIWVKIRKLLEKNGITYYAIFKQDHEIVEFYMGINKKKQLLLYFHSDDFRNPIKIIDLTKKDAIIYPLENVPEKTFSRSVIQGIRAVKMPLLPEILDYIA